MRNVQFSRVRQVGRGRQDERQQVLKFRETVPGLSWSKALFAQLARRRQEFACHLPEEDAIRGGSDQVERDRLAARLRLIAGVNEDVCVNGDHAVPLGWEAVPPRKNACWRSLPSVARRD